MSRTKLGGLRFREELKAMNEGMVQYGLRKGVNLGGKSSVIKEVGMRKGES